jgi:hypothetical protein
MKFIKAGFMLYPQTDQQGEGHTDGKSKNVDESQSFILQ